jgi:hypothetical protein
MGITQIDDCVGPMTARCPNPQHRHRAPAGPFGQVVRRSKQENVGYATNNFGTDGDDTPLNKAWLARAASRLSHPSYHASRSTLMPETMKTWDIASDPSSDSCSCNAASRW